MQFKENWRLLFTPNEDPYMNMAIDEVLATECAHNSNGFQTMRFYTWKFPSCSIGYFQKIENVLDTLKENAIPIVRRPTGGGIVFHGNDITFSIIKKRVPDKNSEDMVSFYKLIGKSIMTGLKKLGISCKFHLPKENPYYSKHYKTDLKKQTTLHSVCSVTPAKYDILINGSKVAGYAARRSRDILLCQGYLDVFEICKQKNNDSRTEIINLLFKNLVNSFENVFEIKLISSHLSINEDKLANQIKEKKYSCKEWNFRK